MTRDLARQGWMDIRRKVQPTAPSSFNLCDLCEKSERSNSREVSRRAVNPPEPAPVRPQKCAFRIGSHLKMPELLPA
jgi:hypothetical protein